MLKKIYGGDIDAVDPFVCMMAEKHRDGSEMGGLQHAVIKHGVVPPSTRDERS